MRKDHIEKTKDGEIHYTRISGTNKTTYYNNDKLIHRDDGPAEIFESFCEIWYQNGKIHRDDGPAIAHRDGGLSWFKNGQLHREDGPANTNGMGYEAYYIDGKLHRIGGPAVIRPSLDSDDEGNEFWIYGVRLTGKVLSWMVLNEFKFPLSKMTEEQQILFKIRWCEDQEE